MVHSEQMIIESLGVYLPPKIVSTTEVMEGCKNEIRFPFEKVTGIKNRRTGGQDEFSIDLAKKAIAKCLEKSKYNPSDIDILISCNISKYDGRGLLSLEPSTSIQLRNHFGFANAIVFDITNACAGMFTGIYIVRDLLRTGAIRRGMVVSGENITHLTRSAQREIEGTMDSRMACLTLGDSGAAIILENAKEKDVGFKLIDLQTLGQYSKYCIAKPSEQRGMIMYTDSVNMTNVGIKAGANHAFNTLQKAGWPFDGFQHLILHQTSKTSMNSAMQEINNLLDAPILHDGNTVNILENRGNTSSTSHFVALSDEIYNKNIKKGDKVVFGIAASGLTVGTALYVFDDLPDRMHQKEISKASDNIKQDSNKLNNTKSTRIRVESVGTVSLDRKKRMNTMELSVQAAENCLKKSSYQYDDIGLLIYTGIYRTDYILEPAYATLLAGELGMNSTVLNIDDKKTIAFDVFNGAIGFLNACYIAKNMIESGTCEAAMIVASENENNAENFPTELIGINETASALILDAKGSKNAGFSNFLFNYEESNLDSFISYFDNDDGKPYLHILKDSNLEELYIKSITPMVKNLLELEGINMSEIDLIFPPQTSSRFIDKLSRSLELPINKFVTVPGNGLDLYTSSIPYSIEEAYNMEAIKPGTIGLVIAIGSGNQLGCAIYHF